METEQCHEQNENACVLFVMILGCNGGNYHQYR